MFKSQQKVLVIDDQKVVRFTLSLALKNIGYTNIFEAEDGEVARQTISNQNIDLVFCDLNMPVEDGFSVLKFLDSINFRGTVVLISGEETELLKSTSNLAKLYNLNILGYLEKPITLNALEDLLNQYEQSNVSRPTRKLNALISQTELLYHIENDNVVVFFQPQIDLKTQKATGFEVLARIIDDSGNVIYPDAFIEVAERHSQTIIALTEKVILTAFKNISKHATALKDMTLALNISGRVLESGNFARWLHEKAQEYAIPKEQIICELTETALNDDQKLIDTQLLRLKMMKFRLSIDDFGTGYSSIAQLHAIPFCELKIDKRFVMDCLTNHKSAAIIEQSINMAQAMKIDVVAEGVEDEAIADYLLSLGCDIGQGYYYAKPQPLSELIALMHAKNYLSKAAN